MRVCKWGDSLAVILPVALAERLGVKEGDEVEVTKVELATQKKPDRSVEELFERVRQIQDKFPANFKFNRVETNERR